MLTSTSSKLQRRHGIFMLLLEAGHGDVIETVVQLFYKRIKISRIHGERSSF